MAPPPPVINPADRLSKLPEEIQAQILSFLPAQDAVRTCVLARTWRHAWKFTRRLLITGKSIQEIWKLVDRLIRVRHDGLEVACLDASEIRFHPSEDDDEEYTYGFLGIVDMYRINTWIRRVLKLRIQMLRIDIGSCLCLGYFAAHDQQQHATPPRLLSSHLTRLELAGLRLLCRCLNLDGCPALEHLEIDECFFGVRKIMSLSLKRLAITYCESSNEEDQKRIQICVPRLVSLCLDNTDLRTPVLQRMPHLVEAEVRIDTCDLDICYCDDPMACYHVTRDGDTSDTDSDSDYDSDGDDEDEGSGDYNDVQNTTKCVVLEGLAQAKDLVLIAYHSTVHHSNYIFRRDLSWCPTFSKLKTLVLNHVYWCQPTDCSALACILEHAPLLEKLTLISDKVDWVERKYKVQMKGYPDAKVKSTKISQHLQIVEINFEGVNERFLNLLHFLGTHNIRFEIGVTKCMP